MLAPLPPLDAPALDDAAFENVAPDDETEAEVAAELLLPPEDGSSALQAPEAHWNPAAQSLSVAQA